MRPGGGAGDRGGGRDALAFAFAGLVAGVALLPSERLLDLKPAAALLAAAVLALGWALGRPLAAWQEPALTAWRWGLAAACVWALAAQWPGRVSAGFGNPGYFAAFLCLSWPLALGRPWLLALALATLAATGSRAGLAALVLQGLALAWREPARRQGVVAAGLGLAAWLALAGRESLMRPTWRPEIWRQTLAAVGERPLTGWGLQPFAAAMEGRWDPGLAARLAQSGQYVEHPHQLLLGVLFHGGLLGLVGLGLGLALLWRRLPWLGLGLLGLFLQSQADRFFFQAAALGLPLLFLGLQAPARGRVLGWVLAPALAWLALQPLWQWRQATAPALPDVPAAPMSAVQEADPAAWDRRGTALASAGDFAGAAAAFRRALQLEPSAGRALNLGNSLFSQGLFKEAEAAYGEALRLDPRSADAHFGLGYALFRQRRIREALAALDQALRLDPRHAEAATLKRQILR